MVIDSDDQDIIGKYFINPPKNSKTIPVNKNKEEAEDYTMNESDNYPSGADNDPNAPWNQVDDNSTEGKISNNQLAIHDGDTEEEVVVQDSQENWYVINIISLKENPILHQDILIDYGNVPYTEEPSPDGDGNVDREYDFSSAELSIDEILNAAGDYINKGDVGDPRNYENGDHFVYPLTKEMSLELIALDSILKHNGAVQKIANQ